MDGSIEPVGRRAAGKADDLTRDLGEAEESVGGLLVISPSRRQLMGHGLIIQPGRAVNHGQA